MHNEGTYTIYSTTMDQGIFEQNMSQRIDSSILPKAIKVSGYVYVNSNTEREF